jgi:hypothetical protein
MSEQAPTYGEPIIAPDVVMAVKLPVPLNRMGRYLRGWSKDARMEKRGGYLVVIEPGGEQ